MSTVKKQTALKAASLTDLDLHWLLGLQDNHPLAGQAQVTPAYGQLKPTGC